MKAKKVIYTSILNGLFFSLPFLFDSLFFLLFIAVAFLFYNQEKLQKRSYKATYLLICVPIWQFIVLYWFHGISPAPFWSVNLIILLSIIVLMAFFSFFFLFIMPLNIKWKYAIFCFLWITYEIFWIEWEIPYPMLSLGLVLGNFPFLIQWYPVTGITGGSLWILLVNFLVLKLLKKEHIPIWSISVLFPILISVCIYFGKKEDGCVVNAVAVNNKLDDDEIDKVMMLLTKEIDKDTDIIVCPEGLLYLPFSSIPINRHFSKIKRILSSQSPDATIVLGSMLYESFLQNRENRIVYNIALQCDTTGFVTFRNKKTLVPFGETIPFEKYLGELNIVTTTLNEPISYNDGQDRIFEHININLLPLICYELYFSNLIRTYYNKTAVGIICCLSNEYSVPNKTYYSQFLRMTKIQAITFRTPIIKSTVNGYSSIIDSKGNIISTGYNTNEVIKGMVNVNPQKTIFSKYGYFPVFVFFF